MIEQLLGPFFEQLKAGISSVIENMIAERDYVIVQTSGVAETKDGKPYNNTYRQVMKVQKG